MDKLTYYLYNNITGTHPIWIVAILAVSQADADNWVKTCWHGGKRLRTVTSGKVEANCGDVTERAGEILRNKLNHDLST